MDLGLGFDQAAIGMALVGMDGGFQRAGGRRRRVGFDPATARERAAATGHLGLRSMAERIQTAGGSLAITSVPGRGTRVVLRLPV